MEEKKKPWSPAQMIWSAVLGIVVWTALGFGWLGFGFGWVTPGNAERASADAVVGELATICVAQAESSPNSAVEIEKLSDMTTWKQREFVEKAGWATMHGSERSRGGVADQCATQLREAAAEG